MNNVQLRLTGHLTPTDKARSDYRYVPFELPAPATRLRVRYCYSAPMSAAQREGGNVIDIGLFDPRGSEFPGGAGFRGWSGSARDEFVITPDDATPGYLPGPLPTGQYQIILGLYRIRPAGADYTIEIAAELDQSVLASDDISHLRSVRSPALQASPDQSDLPRDSSGPSSIVHRRDSIWLRGDLQSHTYHSDARGTPKQLTDKVRSLGLDFLAITDHNTISHHAHLPTLAGGDLLLIPGQEATTYYGHMNIWGTERWCDFRCKTPTEMAQVIALAHAKGGTCSINHPKTDGPPWKYGDDLPVDALEVWQGPWPNRNTESLARWERLLARGRRITAVGGSDYHCPAGEETGIRRLGQPTTWVRATERSVTAILAAIRKGHVSISAFPDGPRINLRAHAGSATAEMGEILPLPEDVSAEIEIEVERGAGRTLRLIIDGAVAHEAPIATEPALIKVRRSAARYIRAELVGDTPLEMLPPNAPANLDLRDWRWALSNPIYIG